MKNYFSLTILTLFLSGFSFGQSTLFYEGFEGIPSTTTYSSLTVNSWALNTNLQAAGLQSDSASVALGDSIYLETPAFNTTSVSFLTLSFDHICKVDFFDKAIVQVSTDNGSSWINLTSAEYTGGAFFSSGSFSAVSYSNWNIAMPSAVPDNSWWKTETFDLSNYIGSSQTKIRFALIDGDNNGARNNYGWLLDEIKIIGAPCELIPPKISLTGTVLQGQVYSTGPYTIEADIQDASGIDSVSLSYTINNGSANVILMNNVSGNTFVATIPSASVGDIICYSIYANDNTNCKNSSEYPSTSSCVQFNVASNPPPNCLGTPVFAFPYTETFASFSPGDGINTVGSLQNNWINENSDNTDWFVYNQPTRSTGTGPTQDHSTSDANYLYIEATNTFNQTAILNTPCYDLSNLVAPKFSFWYHMDGVSMGSLHVDIYFGGVWVLDIMPQISGSQGSQWLFREIDLSQYAGNIVQLRFRGITGSGFQSDIAIDDISIIEPIANDIRLDQVITPNISGCNGSATDFVTLKVKNLGSLTQNSIPLAYQLQGGVIVRDTAFVSLAPGDSVNHTFQQTVNLSAPATYVFDFWVELSSDQQNLNDTILNYSVSSSSVISSFPDTTDFDNFTTGTPGVFIEGWNNSVFDQHDWYVNSNATNSNFTGPTSDHTSGNGNYVYVEATNFANNEAILLSRCFDIRNLNQPELSFYYHMEGLDMGSLEVDIILNGIPIQGIISPISGDQGNSWNLQTVDLTPFKGIVKILFKATVGNDYRSDIAIDDIIIRDANPVGIRDITFEVDDVLLYPNPVLGTTVKIERLISNSIVIIRDARGKEMKKILVDGEHASINVEDLSAGMYFVEILANEKKSARKVKKLVIR